MNERAVYRRNMPAAVTLGFFGFWAMFVAVMAVISVSGFVGWLMAFVMSAVGVILFALGYDFAMVRPRDHNGNEIKYEGPKESDSN